MGEKMDARTAEFQMTTDPRVIEAAKAIKNATNKANLRYNSRPLSTLIWDHEWELLAKAAILSWLSQRPTAPMYVAGDEEVIASLNEYPKDVEFTKGTPAYRAYVAMTQQAKREIGGE